MKQKNTVIQAITPPEIQLIEQLRQHPEIQARLQSILEIVRNEDGPLKTADQVEELLIQELRRLGSTTYISGPAKPRRASPPNCSNRIPRS